MRRDSYKVFSEGRISGLTLSNRLVRSATWERLNATREVTDELLDRYRELAKGGVGMIITGLMPAFNARKPSEVKWSYDDVWIEGISRLPEAVHRAAPNCKIFAQLFGWRHIGPSNISTPFIKNGIRALSKAEIRTVVECFVQLTMKMKEAGFDGVQLHAAHGKTSLFNFLSPFTNHRADEYGGSARNRARIIREIVSEARRSVGDFPILIKMNCTDNIEGVTDIDSFPQMAQEIESAGIDAVEVSGGTIECLLRTEEELGFRPVVSAESHTNITAPEKQSYYLKYVEELQLSIPVILVGGNRDIERMEKIIQEGSADFVAMCRPLICEPDLPRRWLEGLGSSEAECVTCGSCRYGLRILQHNWAICFYKHDKDLHKKAQKWLLSWVDNAIQR